MKPVHFPIKMLTLLTIFGFRPVQAAPQQGLLDDHYRWLRLRLSTLVIACLLTAAATTPAVTT